MNKRWATLLGLLAWIWTGLACAAEGAESRSPNVIFVLADDLGLSRVGCYGGGPFKTPHLDRMAERGLRFERCYSMPICGPSRAVLLTGKYPFRTGAVDNATSVIDPQKHPTVANVLQEAGYATCAIGKLGQSAEADDAAAPRRLGFDESMLWMGRGTPDRYWGPRYFRNGEAVQAAATAYGPDETHAFLVDFMMRHRTTPFFVYYSAVLTHEPYTRTPDSRDGSRVVVDMAEYLDKLMGRLVDDLERLGLSENTIVMFTSDNGPAGDPLGTLRGQPMLGSKGDVTEGGVREPLIVWAPGRVAAGTVSAELVDFSDFFPTILELAGVAKPPGLLLDGLSFAGQLGGKPAEGRKWVYSQLGRNYFIANGQYKLYGDGRMVDVRNSPVAEAALDESDPAVRAARRTLEVELERLRAGYPAVTAPRGAAAKVVARGESLAELEADLQLLAEANLLAEPERWQQILTQENRVEGGQVGVLIEKAAKKLRPDSRVEDAVKVLREEGVINAAAVWKEQAIAGRMCSAANVVRLINKLALRLRMK